MSFTEIKKTISVEHVSVIVTVLAISLWVFSLSRARLTLDSYGLIHSLPFSYFAALGLLTISSAILWPSRKNHSWLLFSHLCFLIVSLWLTPLLIGGMGNSQEYFAYPFGEWGFADYIIRNGHYAPDIFFRMSFPGIYVLGATVANVLGINNPTVMITILPFLWQFVLLLPLYCIFRNVLGEENGNYHWAALWIFYAGGWSAVANFHPQTVSNLLFLVLLALLVKYVQKKGSGGWEQGAKAGMIIALGALTVNHLNTPIVVASILAVLAVTRKLNATFAMIAVIFIAAWFLFQANVFLSSQLPAWVAQLFRLDRLWSAAVPDRLTGSAGHQTVVWVRMLFTVLFGTIGAIGFFLGRGKRVSGDVAMLLIGIGAAIVALILGPAHGWETPQRYYFFIMPPLAYFITKWLRRRVTAVILVGILLLSPPLFYVARYGNQLTDYASPATIASWDFFNDSSTGGLVVGTGWYGAMKNIEKHRISSLTGLALRNTPTVSNLPETYSQYIALGEQDQKIMEEILGKPDYIPELERELGKTAGYNIVYVNPDVRIYLAEGPVMSLDVNQVSPR